jgi:hypothetical protein
MFRAIKLYFTDRLYYKQWKNYMSRRKAVRKKLKKQIKEFCPWSGYYMHEMIKTMLEFYHKTYLSGDCCWSEDNRREEIATSLGIALHWANELDIVEDLEDKELIKIAQKDKTFEKYVADWEKKIDMNIGASNHKEALLGGLAEEYLIKKYTKAMYKVIGEHIWDWCD